jgi:aspartokinase
VRKAAPGVAAVVSAANGVTDLLLDAGQSALRGDRAGYITAAKKFEMRHDELIDGGAARCSSPPSASWACPSPASGSTP